MIFLEKLSLATVVLFILGAYSLIMVPGIGPLTLVLFFILVGILGWLELRGSITFHKTIMLGIVLAYIVVSMLTTAIAGRQAGTFFVHDNVLQLEVSLEYLKEGKNPYTYDYIGTRMEGLHTIQTVHGDEFVNPALYHNLKLPFHMAFSLPFSYMEGFDQRYVYGVVFIILLGVLLCWPKKYEHKALLVTLFTLNPLFLQFFVTGRDDVFVLTWVLLSVFLLSKKKYHLSAIVLGLALASKHSAVILLPFYVAHIYYLSPSTSSVKEKSIAVIKKTYPAVITACILFIPFIAWDPPSFWQDNVQYPLGMVETGYPINGYGLQSALVEVGYIASPEAYFSNLPLLLIIAFPLLWFLITQQKKRNTTATLLIAYGVFMLVFWMLSRFFHDNHVGYVAQILLVGVMLAQKNQRVSSEPV